MLIEEFFDYFGFIEEKLQSWTFSLDIQSSIKINDCSVYRLIGGLGSFTTGSSLERTFSGLPPHYLAVLSFKIMKIDDWNTGAKINIFVDDSVINSVDMTYYNQIVWSTNYCGNSNQKDQIVNIYQSFQHSKESLRLKIQKEGGATTENWGVFQIFLKIQTCNPSCKKCKNSTTCSDCDEGMAYIDGICRCTSK